MRRLQTALLAAALIASVVAPCLAQSDAATALEITRGDIQADRKALVALNLTLTEAQAAEFWPLYREYRAEMEKVGDGLMALITDFAKNYDTLSDEQANKMVESYLGFDDDANDLREKYRSRFGKIIPGKSVMRFYQIENKLDAIVMMDLVQQIPLAKH